MCVEARIRVRPVVPGDCSGELLVLDRNISFFGEVDPETGCLRDQEDICILGKVLAFRGSRGSTVSPYILYALRKNAKNPVCLLVVEIEPMLIAGSVLGEIPLYIVENFSELLKIPNGMRVEVKDGELHVYG